MRARSPLYHLLPHCTPCFTLPIRAAGPTLDGDMTKEQFDALFQVRVCVRVCVLVCACSRVRVCARLLLKDTLQKMSLSGGFG